MRGERATVLAKIGGVGTAVMVWRKLGVGQELPSVQWFGGRFLQAATVVVDRWGPRWTRKRIVSQTPVGAWLLLALWLGLPMLLLKWFW